MKLRLPSKYLTETQIILLLPIFVILAGAIFFSYKAYQSQVLIPWNNDIRAYVSKEAEACAERVSTYFSGIVSRLKESTANTQLIDALLSGDGDRITRAQNTLHRDWPELTEFFLVRDPTQFSTGKQNFVALDLLSKAAGGEPPTPAAIKLDGIWTIYIAEPVRGSETTNEVAGVLLISLLASSLEQVIERNSISGQIEVSQSAAGFGPQSVFAQGSPSAGNSAIVSIRGMDGWQLSFTPSADIANLVPKPMTTFLVSLASVVVLGLALIVLIVRQKDFLLRFINIPNTGRSEKEDEVPADELDKIIAEKLESRNQIEKIEQDEITVATPVQQDPFPAGVFRDYDIRGNAHTEITSHFAESLGKTLAVWALDTSNTALGVAIDGRITSPGLKEALIDGIISVGCNVTDLGMIPTPVFNFALQSSSQLNCGVMVTASHNPADDNGFKIIMNGNVLSSDEITGLGEKMRSTSWPMGKGHIDETDILDAYAAAFCKDIKISKPLHVVIDGANGVMGPLAPKILSALDCEVLPLYCNVDGKFPFHPPDPSDPRNLQDLIATVRHENADLGLAFDGDGDRLVAISAAGRIVWPDELMMIFSRDLLTKQPDSHIVFDVKSTRRLEELIASYGGHPVLCKTGHSNIRRKILETDAPLGGEFSGHIFFSDRWYGFDDGLYAAARLMEIMDIREQSLDDIVDSFEQVVATPEIKISVADNEKFELINQLVQVAEFEDGSVSTLDGLRVEFPDSWGLVRASNTSASLTLRFEGKNEKALENIMSAFKKQLAKVSPTTEFPF